MSGPALIFVTHPEVVVDPAIPVPRWHLSDQGRARMARFAASPVVARVGALWCSDEVKAIEAAAIAAAALRLTPRQHPGLGENDRSATGYLPPDAFETAADAFFAHPDISVRGWERALDAQARILRTVRTLVAGHGPGDLMIVSHGAVGTLLSAALHGVPIHRRLDQPSQGHFWRARLPGLEPLHGWRPIA